MREKPDHLQVDTHLVLSVMAPFYCGGLLKPAGEQGTLTSIDR
jgi:hypothetical protein